MPISPDFELQTKIVELLEGNAALMALVGGVYDHVPEGPYRSKDAYISFGPEYGSPMYLSDLDGEDLTVQIDVWTCNVGRTLCKTVCRMIEDIIEQSAVVLAQNAAANVTLSLKRIIPDPTEGITHGVLQFEFELERVA